MHTLLAMFTTRPYVLAFLLAFAVLAYCERGPLRAVFWLLSGTFLGWLSEFCSVNTGFPFGHYVYHAEQFAGELWIGPVPLFASISFAFMSYFAFSAARRLNASWQRSGLRFTTPDVDAYDGTVGTLVLAAVIGMWMDTVIDPLTLLGHYWFLGDLYHYDPPGLHFGVPLSNYLGWVLTIGTIVAVNQRIDRALQRRGVPLARGPVPPLEAFWGIASCLGVFKFMMAINLLLLVRGAVPPQTPLASMFVSGAISTSAFVVFCAVMIYRGFVSSPFDDTTYVTRRDAERWRRPASTPVRSRTQRD